jgi:hypothetical protein
MATGVRLRSVDCAVNRGHRRGIVALREATQAARLGSTSSPSTVFDRKLEARDGIEISLLLDLLHIVCEEQTRRVQRNNVPRQGDPDDTKALPRARASRRALDDLIKRGTADNHGLLLNLAVRLQCARKEMSDYDTRVSA